MELLADGLLLTAAMAGALYCWILSKRLKSLKDLDSGLGGAIAGLSRQVDETRSSLAEAKATTEATTRDLAEITARAEIAAGRLELLLASVHEGEARQAVNPDDVREQRQTRSEAQEARDQELETLDGTQEDLLQALKSIIDGRKS